MFAPDRLHDLNMQESYNDFWNLDPQTSGVYNSVNPAYFQVPVNCPNSSAYYTDDPFNQNMDPFTHQSQSGSVQAAPMANCQPIPYFPPQNQPTPTLVNQAPTSSVFLTPESPVEQTGGTDKDEPKQVELTPEQKEKEDEPLLFIDGRLPVVNNKGKYAVSLSEIRRRVGAPEFMNLSTLQCFFRKSKNKENSQWFKNLVADNKLNVKAQRRQRKQISLSSMTEGETQTLVSDLNRLCNTYLPVEDLSRKMIEQFLSTNQPLPQIIEQIQNSLSVLNSFIKSLSARQPAITGRKEVVKGNSLDKPYENYSMLTHGLGHPFSLLHYRNYVNVLEAALLKCKKVLNGQGNFEAMVPLAPGAKPFRTMRDEFFNTKYKTNTSRMVKQKPMKSIQGSPIASQPSSLVYPEGSQGSTQHYYPQHFPYYEQGPIPAHPRW